MKTVRQITVAFVLFLSGTVYSQDVKQPSISTKVYFGKFALDSMYLVSVKEILFSDSLFIIGRKDGGGAGKIVSFDVYTRKDSLGFTESTYGNRLSKKQKFLINSASPGQKVYFQNIMIRYPGEEKIKLNSKFIFKIKK